MKKKEIMALMDAKRAISRLKDAVPYGERRFYNSSFALNSIMDGTVIPNVPEVQEQLDILKEEMLGVSQKSIEASELIKSIKCTHDVRLTHYSLCDSHYCVFCGKEIYGENCGNWELSRYRNAHCVNLVDINQSEADISGGYTITKVFEIIDKILKDKDDEDEVDLVEEFSKLNLPYCEINNKKVYPETFIMIIGGTNTYKLSKDVYTSRARLEISKTICEFFTGQLDTKVLLIDNPKVTNKFTDYSRNLEVESYDSLNAIKSILDKHKEDYKLIIDISELYDYKIQDNELKAKEIDLKLQEKFPNAKVIRIKNFTKKDATEIVDFFSSSDDENTYGYQNNKYYHNEDGKCEALNENDAFQKIKTKI